jgi:23S rRNA (cytosine1962-C5)-methyltransferase
MNPSIYLHASKQGTIRRGHPWIFPKAISRQVDKPKTGELVSIYSDDGTLFGTGIYNEHSLYRVRVLAVVAENIDASSLASIVLHRLQQARQLRQSLNLPNSETTAYRLFNSEGDGLSGLTIDRFNHVCVVSSTAYWVEAHKKMIMSTIQTVMPGNEIIWLPQVKSLAQDGWNSPIDEKEERSEQVLEEGILFQVDFSNAQKTGLFLDQRDNHARIAALSAGKRVLDLYTYTGGFALHAAKAGATLVTAVDSSENAIASAKKNAELNKLNAIEWIESDARDHLSKAGDYDIIILDPPKLAPSQQHIQRAKNYYRFLHREVFKAMRPGSLLMTCNCSSALSTAEFTELAYAQARAVGKSARVLGVFGPATCHPTLPAFPEGNYLTAVLLGLV